MNTQVRIVLAMSPATIGTDEGLQRAAVVLAALGPGGLAALAPALGAEVRAALEAAHDAPGRLSAQERRRLLASVAQACRSRHPAFPRASCGSRPRAPGEDTDRLPCLAPRTVPFAFMDDAEPADMAAMLSAERPGIVALVVAHASDETARALAAALPPEARREVTRTLPLVRRPAPGVLRRLGDGLQEEIAARRGETRQRLRTARRIAAAVAGGDEALARQVLDELADRDPALCSAVARELGGAPDIPAESCADDRSASL